jgi:hypothetical protein
MVRLLVAIAIGAGGYFFYKKYKQNKDEGEAAGWTPDPNRLSTKNALESINDEEYDILYANCLAKHKDYLSNFDLTEENYKKAIETCIEWHIVMNQ